VGRSATVFPGPPNNKQDRTWLFLYRPGNISPLRHLQNCRTKFDPRAILKRLRSARIFYRSNFPALFSNLFCTKKSAGKFDLWKIHADPKRSNIIFPLVNQLLGFPRLVTQLIRNDYRWCWNKLWFKCWL